MEKKLTGQYWVPLAIEGTRTSMMRKRLLIILILLEVTIGSFSQQRPNIIFILTDDLGYGDVGAFFQNRRKQRNDRSEPWFLTPQLDRLANEGVMLTNHYSGAPVCAPSRASLLSGLSQGHATVRDNQFDKALSDNWTLASMLQTAGYETAAIGKWGLQGNEPDWPAHPLKRGFAYYFGYIRHRDGHEHYPKEGIYRGPKEMYENYSDISTNLDKCYTGDLFTAAAKRWIIEHQRKQSQNPFFLYLSFDTPHAALELPTQPYPTGGGLNGGIQWIGTPGHMINTASGEVDTWTDPEFVKATWDHDKNPITPEVPWPDTYKRYATVLTRIDQQVGDLMQVLEDLRINDNTLVIFTSDNGPSRESYLPNSFVPFEADFFNSFGPFDGIKRDLLEGGIRVPTIVKWPQKISPSKTIASPSAFYDWMPTLAEAAGIPVPAFCDGRSFLNVLTGDQEDLTRTVYIEYFENNKTPKYAEFDVAHQQKSRKQMQFFREGNTIALRYNINSNDDDFEIYAIDNDPQQVNDLIGSVEFTSKQAYYKDQVIKRRMPDSTAVRPYDNALISPVETGKLVKPGFHYQYFAGTYDWIPLVDQWKATLEGTQPGLPLTDLQLTDGILLVSGFIKATANGTYTFSIQQSGTVLMKVHDVIVFNNEERFNQHRSTSSIRLKKGLHPYRLYFFVKPLQSIGPQILWAGPGLEQGEKLISYLHDE